MSLCQCKIECDAIVVQTAHHSFVCGADNVYYTVLTLSITLTSHYLLRLREEMLYTMRTNNIVIRTIKNDGMTSIKDSKGAYKRYSSRLKMFN